MRVAGFGMNSRATLESLRAALAAAGPAEALAALAAAGPTEALAALGGAGPAEALAALPGHAAMVAELARALDLPLIEVASVAGIPTPTQSPRSLAAHHTGSVAEAVALAAAGPGARLLAPRATSPDRCAICAIALAQPGTPA
ncbi:MAG TPA: cobalamin biosynthesis protein [Paracoccus solventivorans]|uniref:precorrin methylase n=1 Tax=Paracoccus solventivorans TaxID=53463 RepID=UPI002B9A1336|nr:precorrin methylase [Paracoccus solventivorans]HMM10050.1 cobalamin biosynthesis protein [Paracoccus solventivorans]